MSIIYKLCIFTNTVPVCCAAHPSKRLEDSSQHVLCDVEVQGADIQTHGSSVAFLQVVGHRSRPVLFSLQTHKVMLQRRP